MSSAIKRPLYQWLYQCLPLQLYGHPRRLLGLGFLLLLLSLLLSLSLGAYQSVFADWGQGGALVFWHIRMPRVLLCVIAGVALGVSGALIQGLFRNPLADPSLIGVSSGAALGAALSLVIGWQWLGISGAPWIQMSAAFVGALLVTTLTWWLAHSHHQVSITRLLLIGIAINALAAAALGWLSFLANDQQLRSLTFWMLGSLSGSMWTQVLSCLLIVALALGRVLIRGQTAQDLNALCLGPAQACLLGVDVGAVQRRCLVCVALSVGAVTALTGMIGFVGLLAPHLVRLVAGPDHRWVLPGSALVGAILVLLADTAARILVAPAELPLGVLTGLIGACTFVWMLRRQSLSGSI